MDYKLIPYYNTFNTFFSADTPRVIFDLTIFRANHYRTSVHPIFVLLFNPLGVLLTHILPSKNVFIIAAFLNNLMVIFSCFVLYFYLKKLKTTKTIRLLLILLFIFANSNVIFGLIPETYAFATFSLLLSHYIFLLVLEKINIGQYDKAMRKRIIYFLISILFCFGITITNIIVPLILLLVIIIKFDISKLKPLFKLPLKNNIKGRVILFCTATFIVVICGVALANIQKTIYPSSQIFYSNAIKEELNYTQIGNASILQKKILISKQIKNIARTIPRVFANFTMYNFISPRPDFNNKSKIFRYSLHSFNSYNLLQKTIVVLWILILFGIIFIALRDRNIISIAILLSLGFNFVLHNFYGSLEPFLYSPHVTYLWILLLANTRKKILELKFIQLFLVLMIIIAGYSNINNLGS